MIQLNNKTFLYLALFVLICSLIILSGCGAEPIYGSLKETDVLQNNENSQGHNLSRPEQCLLARIVDIKIRDKDADPNFDAKLEPLTFTFKESLEQRITYAGLELQKKKIACANEPSILLISYSISEEPFFLQRQVFAARQRLTIYCEYELLKAGILTPIKEGRVSRVISYLVPVSAYASILSKEDILYGTLGDIVDEIVQKIEGII